MKYTIHINQPRAIELGITNINQAIVLDLITGLSSWAAPVTIDGEIYYWGCRHRIAEELPLLSMKPDTVYRHLKALVKLGLVEYKKSGKRDCLRLSEKGKSYYVGNESELAKTPISDLNPNDYIGNKSESQSDPISETDPNSYVGNESENDSNSEINPKKLGNKSENNSEINPTDQDKINNKNTKDKKYTLAEILRNDNKALKDLDPDRLLNDEELISCKPEEVHASLWESFLKLRKRRKAEVTVRATIALLKSLITCVHHGVAMNDMIQTCLEKGWKGVNVEWYQNQKNIGNNSATPKPSTNPVDPDEVKKQEEARIQAEKRQEYQHEVHLNDTLQREGKRLILPRENAHLENFAKRYNLPSANTGESWPQYRQRLNQFIERKQLESQQETVDA